jgi:hypothetical protein
MIQVPKDVDFTHHTFLIAIRWLSIALRGCCLDQELWSQSRIGLARHLGFAVRDIVSRGIIQNAIKHRESDLVWNIDGL